MEVTNFVGTIVMTTDAAGRKSRSLTNALGQLTRVDEPSSTNTLEPLPQSTPTPNPSPSPTPGGGGHQCAANCPTNLNGNDYGSLSTYYVYNVQGKMVKVMQGGQIRYFKYDSLGRLIRVKQPEQEDNNSLNLPDTFNTEGKWSAKFTYDVLGNVLTTTDAKGTIITNVYDKASRVITRTYSGETGVTTPAVSYFYDGKGLDSQQSPNFAKGKLTKVTSSISETRYTNFDYLGRLTRSEQRTPVNTETISITTPRVSLYEYNFAGALIKETYPSGRVVQNEFEADGDLSRIYGKANSTATERTYANSFLYTADGRISQLKLGNGLWESAKFNNRLQVTEFNLGIGVNDASKWKLEYQYGELQSNGTVDTTKNTGNIARQTSSFAGLQNPFVQSFKYDSLNRLIEATEKVGTTQTWKQNLGYDRFGNRMSFTNEINGQVQTNTNLTHPSIDANTNRFNANQGYLYDKNGNVTTDPTNGTRTFTFNGENKQTEVKDAYGNRIGRYFYDGEGKRVKKLVYLSDGVTVSEETVFVYSRGKLVAEYSTQPPPTNPTTNYTMTDLLDSPRVITNALGEVTSRRDFKPFGEEIASESNYRTSARKYGAQDNIRQKFTGYQKDTETNLDFAEARMYQNLHGRFTAVDPLLASGKSANPQTFNRYVYVVNNPLKYKDPTGLQLATVTGQVYTWEENGKTNYGVGKKYQGIGTKFGGTDNFESDIGNFRYKVKVTQNSIVFLSRVYIGKVKQTIQKPAETTTTKPAGNEAMLAFANGGIRQLQAQPRRFLVAGAIAGGILVCYFACGPALVAGGPTIARAATNPAVGLAFGVGLGALAGSGGGGSSGGLPSDLTQRLTEIYQTYGRYSYDCDCAAQATLKAFNDAGMSGEIIEFQTRAGNQFILDALNNKPIAESGFHQAVKVGDRYYDALTGPNGATRDEYFKLFAEGTDLIETAPREFIPRDPEP